jgi:hypothetical protein
VQNPLGHGIGVGGNLSLNMTMIDWGRSQHLGSTDVAVESAIGVLLFQMGVFGVALIAVLGWITAKLWKLYRDTRELAFAMAALGLFTVTVNGIFQEEALFSPLALGLVLGFCGLLLGRGFRRAVALSFVPLRSRAGHIPRLNLAPLRSSESAITRPK